MHRSVSQPRRCHSCEGQKKTMHLHVNLHDAFVRTPFWGRWGSIPTVSLYCKSHGHVPGVQLNFCWCCCILFLMMIIINMVMVIFYFQCFSKQSYFSIRVAGMQLRSCKRPALLYLLWMAERNRLSGAELPYRFWNQLTVVVVPAFESNEVIGNTLPRFTKYIVRMMDFVPLWGITKVAIHWIWHAGLSCFCMGEHGRESCCSKCPSKSSIPFHRDFFFGFWDQPTGDQTTKSREWHLVRPRFLAQDASGNRAMLRSFVTYARVGWPRQRWLMLSVKSVRCLVFGGHCFVPNRKLELFIVSPKCFSCNSS